MAKRAQQESGEGRVTAKSRPMMNLTARTPSFVSSSASSNPVKTWYGYQDPERSVPSDDRTVKPCATVTIRLYTRGLWSVLVFSRVEKWSCGARSIGENLRKILGIRALDWLFDRINLDPKIQIKYVDTKNPTRRHTDTGQFYR